MAHPLGSENLGHLPLVFKFRFGRLSIEKVASLGLVLSVNGF